ADQIHRKKLTSGVCLETRQRQPSTTYRKGQGAVLGVTSPGSAGRTGNSVLEIPSAIHVERTSRLWIRSRSSEPCSHARVGDRRITRQVEAEVGFEACTDELVAVRQSHSKSQR